MRQRILTRVVRVYVQLGARALKFSTGDNNTAIGDSALSANTTGNYNTAVGCGAGSGNTNGILNVCIGHVANNNNFNYVSMIGCNDTATGDNQMRFGSSSYANGAVAAEVNTSANVWNVFINGVAHKILLA
jgi:trimeric autotransporter adhesin